VFCFSLQFLSKIFLAIRRNERDMIKNIYIGVHRKNPLFLSSLDGTEIFCADFRTKNSNIKFKENVKKI